MNIADQIQKQYQLDDFLLSLSVVCADELKALGINGKIAITVFDNDKKEIIASQKAKTPCE